MSNNQMVDQILKGKLMGLPGRKNLGGHIQAGIGSVVRETMCFLPSHNQYIHCIYIYICNVYIYIYNVYIYNNVYIYICIYILYIIQ